MFAWHDILKKYSRLFQEACHMRNYIFLGHPPECDAVSLLPLKGQVINMGHSSSSSVTTTPSDGCGTWCSDQRTSIAGGSDDRTPLFSLRGES